MASSGGDAFNERVAFELSRLREALDDLRRRPMPLDAGTLRHAITASLSEANAPPPNLLVTAIRRLDRVDARLEAIEAALTGPGALPAGGGRGRVAPGPPPPAAISYASHAPAPLPDAEAIAEALARRLGSLPASSMPGPVGGGGVTMPDLVAALRPLVPGAARDVLRRGGREPSPQAVEVLQQTALAALEEAAAAVVPVPAWGGTAPPRRDPPPAFGPAAFAPPAYDRPVAVPPRPALAPGPPPGPPPAPPIDVEALAATIAVRVAASVTASVAKQLIDPRPPGPPAAAPPEREPAPSQVDPDAVAVAVADAVFARLAALPAPQAVVSAPAMLPLLAAVGNVESAVAQLTATGPGPDVIGAVARLEAGVDALARALEEDRGALAEEVRCGLDETTKKLGEQMEGGLMALAAGGGRLGEAADDADGTSGVGGFEVHMRLNERLRQLAPLAEVDLAPALEALEGHGRRVERSVGHILTALAALADHLGEQSSSWQNGLAAVLNALDAQAGLSGPELEQVRLDLGEVVARVDQLMAGTPADRQRLQRLGGSIEGLAELLGLVSERLDRLARPEGGGRPPLTSRPALADGAVRPFVRTDAGPTTDPPPAAHAEGAAATPDVEDRSLLGTSAAGPVSGVLAGSRAEIADGAEIDGHEVALPTELGRHLEADVGVQPDLAAPADGHPTTETRPESQPEAADNNDRVGAQAPAEDRDEAEAPAVDHPDADADTHAHEGLELDAPSGDHAGAADRPEGEGHGGGEAGDQAAAESEVLSTAPVDGHADAGDGTLDGVERTDGRLRPEAIEAEDGYGREPPALNPFEHRLEGSGRPAAPASDDDTSGPGLGDDQDEAEHDDHQPETGDDERSAGAAEGPASPRSRRRRRKVRRFKGR